MATYSIVNWFWSTLSLLFPAIILIPMWISWSRRGPFALAWRDKTLRLLILAVVAILLGFIIGACFESGSTWDQRAI